MAVWIVGFVFRTMFVTAVEHLIFAGALSIVAVIVFEIVRGKARFLRKFKTRRRLTGLIIIVLVIVVGGNSLLGINKTMKSARYFENMVTYDTTNLPFIVLDEVNEIDKNIRLVTKEFAISKAEQNKAIFGSNAELMEANVIHVNDSIYWCMIYAPKSSAQFWTPGQFNHAWGLILVEVNNPNAEPVIINFPEGEFNYADGLWRNHNIVLKNYRRDQGAKYWRSYPAWTGTEWVYVVTRTTRDVYGAWSHTQAGLLPRQDSGFGCRAPPGASTP